jgi:hypothetical protein
MELFVRRLRDWRRRLRRAIRKIARRSPDQREIDACRELSGRCRFIVGYGRSGTTILTQMMNADPRVFILAEALFFARPREKRFSDAYNSQHVGFDNQPTKSARAPNFLPGAQHQWWEWLAAAAQHHDIVGDKIALSHAYFDLFSVDEITSFYEARFFDAKYLFTLRDPVQTVISFALLADNRSARFVNGALIGWLKFLKLWLNFIRLFPNTATVLFENMSTEAIEDAFAFLDTPLRDQHLLFTEDHRSTYEIGTEPGYATLRQYEPQLSEIYALATDTASMPRPLLQAEQKRTPVNGAPSRTSIHPAGELWRKIDTLIAAIEHAPS